MSRIHRLAPVVIDQIAAGEVVERPASVVKEMVENAIDAGATRIEVSLEEGGVRKIEVRDNGSGIAAEDLLLAVTSHATSKLSVPSDLEAIASLGFRGEALASIASVARLKVVSRPHDCRVGTELEVNFGRIGELHEASSPKGTRFLVEDLFAELPARRKFMKRASTEASHAQAWVERLALVHEGIGFRFEHDGKLTFEVHAEDDLEARCAAVFGKGLSKNMVEIDAPGDPLSCLARIGPPESARRDARRVHLFLNGRWVRDARLLRAVREGVKEFVPIGHYPTLFLSLHINPDRVDVNVHPQKTEVRFRDDRLVFGTVVNTLRRGLASAPWATRAVGAVGSSSMQEGRSFPAPSWQRADNLQTDPLPMGVTPHLPMEVAAEDRGKGQFLSVANTFLFRAVAGGVEIVDQHALHERVNLEELRKELQNGAVVMQPLLVPSLVDLSRTELDLLLHKADTFRKLGVDIEAFGETTLAIRGIPARLTRLHPEKLVRDLLDIASSFREASPDQIQEEMLFSMSCRGAVMAGDHLDATALEDLIKRGSHLPQDRTCAHGRPVRVFLSIEDLERAFYRR
ncbi:MAG: DNA mismatch repair endonuclease MutL [Planctomycetota bacterium]